ncbi:hypothetical protein [Saccharopolyspora rectivirgula]|jgi:hypothetical protein|uniref:Uncharacterized protein n=1 Tax=Saccharopolyspora rectivirgula TaxID=28042 RepID=A0A073B8C5_9PSEU|nr:hypothetical protein [Saccharopolyspora rectivirgula]KEI43974.1 hypothetical protein GU90_13490 [Saccharopolyspora rectivirgula]
MEQVRGRLCGGPADGKEITVAVNASGKPIPRITFPATVPNAQAVPPQLVYERRRQRGDGVWEFHYVGAEA